jgi:hypothetical protein
LTNANHFNYRKGNITYSKEFYEAATAVAREIPHAKQLRLIEEPSVGNAKIKVLVGKDLIPHRKYYKGDRS